MDNEIQELLIQELIKHYTEEGWQSTEDILIKAIGKDEFHKRLKEELQQQLRQRQEMIRRCREVSNK